MVSWQRQLLVINKYYERGPRPYPLWRGAPFQTNKQTNKYYLQSEKNENIVRINSSLKLKLAISVPSKNNTSTN